MNSELSRRELIARAGAGGLAAAGILSDPLGPLARPASHAGSYERLHGGWVPSPRHLRHWVAELESFGSRPSGSPSHRAYNRLMAHRYRQAGVREVHLESITVPRWHLPAEDRATHRHQGHNRWHPGGPGSGVSLETIDLSGRASRRWRVANYIPYSGLAPNPGVSAPVALLSQDALAVATSDPARAISLGGVAGAR